MVNHDIVRADLEDKLEKWRDKSNRRPLILEGARQIGKTWLMKKFGEKYFSKTAYFNFESESTLCAEFKNTKDPVRLLSILELYCGFKITASDTLIVFDEVQECAEALNSLKYFAEEAPQYCIIAAGSLLGVSLAKHGFPVGKVEIVKMFPVTFREFVATVDERISNYIGNVEEVVTLPAIVYQRLEELFREYLICGGLPRVITTWLETRNVEQVDEEIRNVLRSYELDFSKHAPHGEMPRIYDVWRSIPSQLAKENRKFVYRIIRTGARARQYENALMWLQQAGMIYRVFECETPKLPLSAYEDVSAFKVYVFDIGILRIMSGIDASLLIEDSPNYVEFKGAFMENYVLQSLMPQVNVMPRYWTSAGKAEVDYLVQIVNEIVPVEVKGSHNTSSKSLFQYIKKYGPKISIVLSTRNIKYKDGVLSLPQSLTDWVVPTVKGIISGGRSS